MKKIYICPSILSCDILNLKSQLKVLEKADIKILHFDVMDGNFVSNISFGESVLKSVKKHTNMLLDVHLLVLNPLKYIEMFYKSGAFSITIHIESFDDVLKCIKKIKSFNCKAAVAINPKTPIEKVLPFLDFLDMVVVMGVNPGFSGQKLIETTLEKIYQIRLKNSLIDIQLDGGVNLNNFKRVVEKGANLVVVGSYIFNSLDILKSVENLKKQLNF